jgi:hypothetical protein
LKHDKLQLLTGCGLYTDGIAAFPGLIEAFCAIPLFRIDLSVPGPSGPASLKLLLYRVLLRLLGASRNREPDMTHAQSESALNLLARDLMNSPAVVAEETMTIREVARLMLTEGVGAVPLPLARRHGPRVSDIRSRYHLSVSSAGRADGVGGWRLRA